jgi:AbiV family abortive infection protein
MGMTKGAKQLTRDQLTQARLKALRNAKEIVNDAKLLFIGKRWARVLFLCRTAEEEMGKYWFVVGAAIVAVAGKIDWKGFWKTFRDHKAKTLRVLHLELWGLKGTRLIEELAELDKRANALERARLSSLYSDFSDSGFVSPDEVIGEGLAAMALKDAMDRLKLIELLEKKVLRSGAALSSLTKEEVEELLRGHTSADS